MVLTMKKKLKTWKEEFLKTFNVENMSATSAESECIKFIEKLLKQAIDDALRGKYSKKELYEKYGLDKLKDNSYHRNIDN